MKKRRKTTKLTDFIPMQNELKDYKKALVKMIIHIQTYLPEEWQNENWFKEGKEILDKYSK